MMNAKYTLGCLALITPLIGWLLWTNPPARAAKAAERKVLFYQDSMHPWVKSDQPGRCTICAMDLTPIYEGQAGFGIGNNVVVLSSNGITVLNVQAEIVQRHALKRSQRVAGTLDANETTKTIISAPAPGRIQALAVDYAGVEVQEGQTLITFFSPELQQRRVYFRAATNQRGQTNDLSTAVFKAGPFSAEIVAPQSGVVLERKVYQGQYVAEGNPQTNTEAGPLAVNQQLALNPFLAEADGISRALAADDLAHFNQQVTKVSAALAQLQKELAAPHRWADSVQRLATLSRTEPAKDLDAAREGSGRSPRLVSALQHGTGRPGQTTAQGITRPGRTEDLSLSHGPSTRFMGN
jgi:hypothetical protein